MRLKDKVATITGAGTGIGEATATNSRGRERASSWSPGEAEQPGGDREPILIRLSLQWRGWNEREAARLAVEAADLDLFEQK